MLSISVAVLTFQLVTHQRAPVLQQRGNVQLALDDALPTTTTSRRAALSTGLLLACQTAPASAALISDVVAQLDKSSPKDDRTAQGALKDRMPFIKVSPASITASEVTITVPLAGDADRFVEYMCVRQSRHIDL